jgi:hypothetical protein
MKGDLMSEKPKQTPEDYLLSKANEPLTKEEMAMYQRVYELAAATGADPLTCMTAGSSAVLGQRMYGGRDSIKRQIVACAEAIIKETKALEEARNRGSLICPATEESGKIILSGPSGIIKH